MIHTARSIFETLPSPARNALGHVARRLPISLRYGRVFSAALAEARLAESLTDEDVARASVRQFRDALRRAAATPFWSAHLRAAGVNPDTAVPDDLRRLPLMDRALLRDRAEEFAVPTSQGRRKWATTGGTSGAPAGFWIDLDASAVDWAYTVHAWSRAGYSLDDPRVVMRGIQLGEGDRRRLTREESIRRELYVSVFDLDADHLPRIRNSIDQFGALFLHGYPSAMEALGNGYLACGSRPPDFRALLAVSENLYPGQRERLETLFSAPVFSFYGMSEKAAFAAECEHSHDLHVEPFYGWVELVDDSGDPVNSPGTIGEIVATSFVNKATALVRYRTGDYSSWAEGECACGRRHQRLAGVLGRWTQEYLVGRGGGRISMTALNLHSSVTNSISRFQFVQSQPGRADLLIEVATGATPAEIDSFVAAMDAKLHGQVHLQRRIVERIELSGRGKHRYIVQTTPN